MQLFTGKLLSVLGVVFSADIFLLDSDLDVVASKF